MNKVRNILLIINNCSPHSSEIKNLDSVSGIFSYKSDMSFTVYGASLYIVLRKKS